MPEAYGAKTEKLVVPILQALADFRFFSGSSIAPPLYHRLEHITRLRHGRKGGMAQE
jgi:hypothetical protein